MDKLESMINHALILIDDELEMLRDNAPLSWRLSKKGAVDMHNALHREASSMVFFRQVETFVRNEQVTAVCPHRRGVP